MTNNFINLLKNSNDPDAAIEVDGFLYSYTKNHSLITYNGSEYLCLRCGSPMYREMDEKTVALLNVDYHVYLLGEDIVWVDDGELKEQIIAMYNENTENTPIAPNLLDTALDLPSGFDTLVP